MAVSLKSKEFSNQWLKSILSDVQRLNGETNVTLVDSPYFTNLELAADSPQRRRSEVQKLKKMRVEQVGRVRRLCATVGSDARYFDWQYFQMRLAGSHSWIAVELMDAFWRRQRVHELIAEHVSKNFGRHLVREQIDRLSRFLLEEIPVLLYIYYVARPQWIDVYPGPQAEVIWAIDTGLMRDELPRITELAARSAPLRYAEVYLQ